MAVAGSGDEEEVERKGDGSKMEIPLKQLKTANGVEDSEERKKGASRSDGQDSAHARPTVAP